MIRILIFILLFGSCSGRTVTYSGVVTEFDGNHGKLKLVNGQCLDFCVTSELESKFKTISSAKYLDWVVEMKLKSASNVLNFGRLEVVEIQVLDYKTK